MRKIKLFACFLLLAGLIAGCGKNANTRADVSYGDKNISNSENLKVRDLYNYIIESQSTNVSKAILLKVMKENVDLNNQDIKELYSRYLNEHFEKTYVENENYKHFGEFDESLLVSYLKSEAYDIKCGEGYSSGYLNDKYFSCDYSDYIDEKVNYDIYLKILKIKYIIEEKGELINKNEARRIVYYSVDRGTNDDVLDKLKSYVDSFSKNQESTDETVVKNIQDIAKIDRTEDLAEIDKQYGYLSTSTDSPNFEYLNKFTKCGEKRCSREEGLAYQRNIVMDKEYFTTKIVIKSDTEVLFESARKLLFSENVNDYLYEIGDKKYLINPASYNEEDGRITDIILYEGATSGSHSSSNKFYLAEVEVIDGDSSFADKALVAELLIDKITDSAVLENCFENVELEIYDEYINEQFKLKYGDYKGE